MKHTKSIIFLALLSVSSLFASEGETLYKACAGCHGANGEKAALGKSEVISGWEVEKTKKALLGYKDGSYGGPMKGVMKGQVSRLDEKQIEALSVYIETLKKQ